MIDNPVMKVFLLLYANMLLFMASGFLVTFEGYTPFVLCFVGAELLFCVLPTILFIIIGLLSFIIEKYKVYKEYKIDKKRTKLENDIKNFRCTASKETLDYYAQRRYISGLSYLEMMKDKPYWFPDWEHYTKD